MISGRKLPVMRMVWARVMCVCPRAETTAHINPPGFNATNTTERSGPEEGVYPDSQQKSRSIRGLRHQKVCGLPLRSPLCVVPVVSAPSSKGGAGQPFLDRALASGPTMVARFAPIQVSVQTATVYSSRSVAVLMGHECGGRRGSLVRISKVAWGSVEGALKKLKIYGSGGKARKTRWNTTWLDHLRFCHHVRDCSGAQQSRSNWWSEVKRVTSLKSRSKAEKVKHKLKSSKCQTC